MHVQLHICAELHMCAVLDVCTMLDMCTELDMCSVLDMCTVLDMLPPTSVSISVCLLYRVPCWLIVYTKLCNISHVIKCFFIFYI